MRAAMLKRKIIPSGNLPSYGFTIKNEQRKKLEAQGQFPKRVPTSERTHGYVEDEILAHGEALIAERDSVE
jgi:hypothetical protein